MDIKKVVITGPESTGKTILAAELASFFKTTWIPEYARGYIMGLNRKYTFDDVEHIALEQIRREKQFLRSARGFLFYDTHLIVTKIWFKQVFGHYPEWLDGEIENMAIGLFLVCNTDIPWVQDPVRENGGEMREVLLDMYIREIESIEIPWALVSGKSVHRTRSAIELVSSHFNIDPGKFTERGSQWIGN
jgi:NadR type nicotinamide-nucleotide adenylyltransferase